MRKMKFKQELLLNEYDVTHWKLIPQVYSNIMKHIRVTSIQNTVTVTVTEALVLRPFPI